MPDLPRSEIEHLVDEWIFNERNRQIVKKRILDGISYEQLAESFFLSVQHTKEITYQSIDIILKHI